MTQEPTLVRQFRLFTLALAALATLTTPVELLMLRHYGTTAQLVPFALVAVTATLLVAVLVRPTATALRVFRWAMLLLLVGIAVGVYFHLAANLEGVHEVEPTLRGLALVWPTLSGPAPALAPGLLAQIALLSLAFAFRHPSLEHSAVIGSGTATGRVAGPKSG